MRSRIKLSVWYALASVAALALVLGVVYVLWYRWPGWFLLRADKIALVIGFVHLSWGMIATFVVANPVKPKTELRRDIALVALLQIGALGYGVFVLWQERPLYYAFSTDRLEVISASAIDPAELQLAGQRDSAIATNWKSEPQWVWAPLPEDYEERLAIVTSALTGGKDVTAMPRYFRRWEEALPHVRAKLKSVAELPTLTDDARERLKIELMQIGPLEDFGLLQIEGRGRNVVAVFEKEPVRLAATLAVK